jgi:hypothetical protein
MMNNWHIKIAKCSEAQKKRLKQVYGYSADSTEYFGIGLLGVTCFPKGELITPDEAFERLGLDEDVLCLKQRIAELEQQLTAKPELQEIDWTLIKEVSKQ